MTNPIVDFVLQYASLGKIQSVEVIEVVAKHYVVELLVSLSTATAVDIHPGWELWRTINLPTNHVNHNQPVLGPTISSRIGLITNLRSSEPEIVAAGWRLGASYMSVTFENDKRTFMFRPLLQHREGAFSATISKIQEVEPEAATLEELVLPPSQVCINYK